MSDIHEVTELSELQAAMDGSYYTILGCGGPLEEWPKMIEPLLAEAGIGKPVRWLATTGCMVNSFIRPSRPQDAFQADLRVLMFPLDGLHVGKLAVFKMQMQDRWFDDVVANTRRVSS